MALTLGAARTVPATWMIPAFGGPAVPAPLRMGFGLALSVLCLPRTAGQIPADLGPTLAVLLLAREVAVGITVGLLGSCIFRAVEAAGRLTDTMRGAGMSEVASPLSEGRSSPLGELNLLLAVVIFVELGGLPQAAAALSRSYDAVPLAVGAGALRLGGVLAVVTLTSAKLLESALAFAAPAIVALLLADLLLGAVGRIAPALPVYFVGMPLKALAGVGVTLLALAGIDAGLRSGFRDWLALIDRGLALWR